MRNHIPYLAGILLLALQLQPAKAQWVQTNGPRGGGVLSFARSGANLLAGTSSGVYQTTDSGSNWTASSAGLPGQEVLSLGASGTALVAGILENGVYFSTNNGTSWIPSNTILPMYRSAVYAFAFCDANIFAALDGYYEGGVYRSTDNGVTWSKTGLAERASIAVVVNNGSLFAGVLDNFVFRSTDNGTTWAWIYTKNGLYHDGVTTLAASDSTIYVGTDVGIVFRSTNNGESWSASTGMYPVPINSLTTSGDNVFAGTSKGVYASTDSGVHWFTAGLADTVVRALIIDHATLFAGTSGGFVWKRPLAEMIAGVESHKEELPGQFALEQNYPNPFNPSTTIRYALPHRSHVALTVYNTLGQIVAKLIHGDIEAGSHDVTFDATGMASGVYFYRLTAGTFVGVKSFLLLR